MKQFSIYVKIKKKKRLELTVAGSSNGFSISVCRRNTFPRDIRQSILSKAGTRSRFITPPTNLQENRYLILMVYNLLSSTLYTASYITVTSYRSSSKIC